MGEGLPGRMASVVKEEFCWILEKGRTDFMAQEKKKGANGAGPIMSKSEQESREAAW